MTPAQIMAEAARILRNMGGQEYDAGYSWGLAERLDGLRDDKGFEPLMRFPA